MMVVVFLAWLSSRDVSSARNFHQPGWIVRYNEVSGSTCLWSRAQHIKEVRTGSDSKRALACSTPMLPALMRSLALGAIPAKTLKRSVERLQAFSG